MIYHEVALAVTAGLLVWLLWESPNQVGIWTFLVLWIMRLSAKLNVYFGVPNMTEEFLQPHLSYLTSYFRKGPVTPLFAVAITGGTVAVVLAILRAVDPATPLFEPVGLVLVGTLLLLAVVEHWFLVLPLRDAVLWRWALREPAPGAVTESDGAIPLRLDVQAAPPGMTPPAAPCPDPQTQRAGIGLLEHRVSAAG